MSNSSPRKLHALLFDSSDGKGFVVGDRCKSFGCAVNSIRPIADAGRKILGHAVIYREPVPAPAYWSRNRAAVEAVVLGCNGDSADAAFVGEPFFSSYDDFERYLDELANVVAEITGDEGDEDPLTVLKRIAATLARARLEDGRGAAPAALESDDAINVEAALAVDPDALCVDAERYRWLRDRALYFEHENSSGQGTPWCVIGMDLGDAEPLSGSSLDAVVDECMTIDAARAVEASGDAGTPCDKAD